MRIGVFILALIGLAGCLGPIELPLLADVELAEGAPESGLVAPDVAAPNSVLEELQSVQNVAEVPAEQAEVTEPVKPRRGFAALFGRRAKPAQEAAPNAVEEAATAAPQAADVDVASDETVGEAAAEADENVVVASVAPQEETPPRRQRNGLFGPRRAKTGQFPQVEAGVVLAFGQIGLACGIRGRALGKEVDRFPERGKGYRLYDSNPSTTGPRAHFITGFKDGCPRQFTASLALLDSPVLHEQLLSVESSGAQHSTAADIAFQKFRAKACRTGQGKVCPEKRISEMEKSMAFVTTYERFGGNANWNEILLHNGAIVANSVQTP